MEFRRKLHERNPSSEVLSLALASAFIRVHAPWKAVDLCSAWMVLSPEANHTRARIWRYRAALACRNGNAAFRRRMTEVARDDFGFIWALGRGQDVFRVLRKTLLREIAGVNDASGIPLLLELEKALSDEPQLLEFLQRKRGELQTLGTVLEEVASRRGPASGGSS